MKIIVTSDLHLGITREARIRAQAGQIAAEAPALTVLAGDLGEPLANFAGCLRLFAGLPGEVAVLAGNHDVWAGGGHHSQDLWERELPEVVRAAGMTWLEDAVWRRENVAVVGTLAWYDYSAADPGLPPYPPEYFARNKGKYNNDATFIDWPWSDQEFAAQLCDACVARLMRLEADPAVRAVVVVTHVPLFEAQMPRKLDDPVWGLSNAYFGNLTLGRRVLAARKVCAVVSGHTHTGRSAALPRLQLPDAPPIALTVVPSDYGAPAYLTVDTAMCSAP
jgi:predicted phosphohydrolase